MNSYLSQTLRDFELLVPNDDNTVLRRCAVAIVELHPQIFAQDELSIDELFELANAAGLQKVTQIENVAVFRSSKEPEGHS